MGPSPQRRVRPEPDRAIIARAVPELAPARVVPAVHVVDVAILAAFVVYAVASGLRARSRASRSLEEYFLAGRSLPGWQAGLSMAATQFAADTPLVFTGLIATAGLFSLWQMWSYGLAFLLLGFLFAPVWRRARVLTDAELAELRYSGRGAALLRSLRALLFGLVFNCVVVAMVLFAATLFAERFLFWDRWLPSWAFAGVLALVKASGLQLASGLGGLAADPELAQIVTANNLVSISAVVLFALSYSTTGGLRGVVATDVGQLAVMMLATAIFTGLAVSEAGGPAAILETIRGYAERGLLGGLGAEEVYALTPAAPSAGLGLVAVFALQWLLQRNADGTGYLAQRAMACRSDADARRASVLFAFVQILLRSLLWVPLGLALLALYEPSAGLEAAERVREREASFVLGVRDLMPAGLRGLMLTAMLAALASTLDTHLNWGSSYLANDLYDRLWCRAWRGRSADPRTQVWVARAGNWVIVGVAVLVMTRLQSVQAAWKATLVLGAGVGAVTVLRWIWWRITAWGELAALGVSFAFAPVALASLESEALQMLGAAGLATAAAGAVSWLGPPTDPERLRRFVEQVRPYGWWGPYGSADGPRRLARALGRTAAAAVTLFGALVGGLWLCVPGPGAPPAWVAAAMLLLGGLALPLWLPSQARAPD